MSGDVAIMPTLRTLPPCAAECGVRSPNDCRPDSPVGGPGNCYFHKGTTRMIQPSHRAAVSHGQSGAESSRSATRETDSRTGGEFFVGMPQEEALARLHFLVDSGRSLGIVGGGAGCGKTWTLMEFAAQSRRRGHEVAFVELTGRDGREFLQDLADSLGARCGVSDPRFQLWRAIRDRLVENRLQRLPTVLVFDHVEDAGDESLDLLGRLLHEADAPEARLTLVLAAQGRAWRQAAPRILERAELKVELDHWSLSDVERFGGWRAARGGVEWAPEALIEVWRVTGGAPRAVRRLVELAQLAVGRGRGERVSAEVIEAVRSELVEPV